MLARGIIRRSTSEYSSRIVVVRKKDGSQRFCVDYRKLNEQTHVETSQVPPIADTLMELCAATIFGTLDLKSGYWQVPLAKDSRHLTAFSTPDGASYEFHVMPFGLAGAPGTFQNLMVHVLKGYLHQFVKVYLDDVVIYSRSHEEHQQHLRLVLERFRMHGLVCAPEKCRLATTNINYLGHIITYDSNLPQPGHLEKIRGFPTPRNIRELRQLLGTANWLRDYVKNFAIIAAPMTDLLAAKKKFQWTADAQEASEKTFSLQTDASRQGMAAVLFQEPVFGQRRIIAYASTKFTAAERRYHINEQEVFAAVKTIRRYHMVLQDKPFRLFTDNRSLLWLNKYKDDKAKLTRWALMLQEYQFYVSHVPSTRNELPEYLSRNPCEALGDE